MLWHLKCKDIQPPITAQKAAPEKGVLSPGLLWYIPHFASIAKARSLSYPCLWKVTCPEIGVAKYSIKLAKFTTKRYTYQYTWNDKHACIFWNPYQLTHITPCAVKYEHHTIRKYDNGPKAQANIRRFLTFLSTEKSYCYNNSDTEPKCRFTPQSIYKFYFSNPILWWLEWLKFKMDRQSQSDWHHNNKAA